MRYAHNVAEIGFSGGPIAAARGRPAGLDGCARLLGVLARATPRTRDRWLADRHGHEGVELRAWSVVVANGQFTDGGLRLSPRSFPGDGVLDALVFRGPRSDAVTMLPRIYRHGDHVPDPHIKELRAKIRVAVRADRPLPVVADGEPLGTTPATFQIVPRAS